MLDLTPGSVIADCTTIAAFSISCSALIVLRQVYGIGTAPIVIGFRALGIGFRVGFGFGFTIRDRVI